MYLAPIPHNLASPGRLKKDRHPNGWGCSKDFISLLIPSTPTIIFEVRFLSFRELLKRNVDNEATSLFSKTGENFWETFPLILLGYLLVDLYSINARRHFSTKPNPKTMHLFLKGKNLNKTYHKICYQVGSSPFKDGPLR